MEVVITAGILTTAIVSILRSFTTVLSSMKLSQDMTLACFLAEDKLFGIEQSLNKGVKNLEPNGKETIQGRDFTWNENIKPQEAALTELEFEVSWQESATRQEKLNINTYLIAK